MRGCNNFPIIVFPFIYKDQLIWRIIRDLFVFVRESQNLLRPGDSNGVGECRQQANKIRVRRPANPNSVSYKLNLMRETFGKWQLNIIGISSHGMESSKSS